MTACAFGGCPRTAHAQGLCGQHYDRVRRDMIRDGDWRSWNVDRSTSIPCTCRSPHWDRCAPMFPNVRVCRWCGSPHADEYGKAMT